MNTTMKGIIKYHSHNKERAAVETDNGYTVFDINHGQISLGDIISGCLNDHGEKVLTNQTTGQTLSVHIESIQASRESVLLLLRHI